jgi:peptidoglycan/LPS O-acetylase OafA/YrhL
MTSASNLLNITKIKRIDFRKDINGLRAIAVLSVVFYHAGLISFSGGWLGVDIFFVISGFLISNIILSDLNSETFSFKNFYLKRAKRILPALFSTILLILPFSYYLLTPKALIEFLDSLYGSIFFYANYFFQNLDFYNAEPTKYMPLLHTWSLSVEEQFYLIFPLISFLVFFKNKNYFFPYLGAVFIISLYLNSTTANLVKFYQIQFRAWELIAGSLVMILSQKINIKHIEKIGVLLVLFSILYFENDMLTLTQIEPKLLVVAGTSLILLSNNSSAVVKFLSHPVLQYFGKISYSLYLFHQPVLAFLLIWLKREGFIFNNQALLWYFLFICFISYLNWKYVEIFFQKAANKKLLSLLFILFLLVIPFHFFGKNTEGFRDRYDFVPDSVLFYSLNYQLYPNKVLLQDFNNHCTEIQNKEKLYIVGDSQGTTFSYSILEHYKAFLACEYEIIYLLNPEGRCLLAQQSDVIGDFKVCSESHFQNFKERISKDNSSIIAIGRFDTWLGEKGQEQLKCKDCLNTEIFQDRLNQLIEVTNHFIIIEPVPTFSFSISESYLYKNTPWGENITRPYGEWKSYLNPTLVLLDKVQQSNVIRIQSENLFCDKVENLCFGSKDKILLYTDSNHLTVEGTKLLIDEVVYYLNLK